MNIQNVFLVLALLLSAHLSVQAEEWNVQMLTIYKSLPAEEKTIDCKNGYCGVWLELDGVISDTSIRLVAGDVSIGFEVSKTDNQSCVVVYNKNEKNDSEIVVTGESPYIYVSIGHSQICLSSVDGSSCVCDAGHINEVVLRGSEYCDVNIYFDLNSLAINDVGAWLENKNCESDHGPEIFNMPAGNIDLFNNDGNEDDKYTEQGQSHAENIADSSEDARIVPSNADWQTGYNNR